MNHLVQTLKWVLVVRGIVAILFGLAAIFLPGLTIKVLIVLFGVTVLVDGFINLIGGFQSRRDLNDWWVYALEGFFSVVLGFITILWPNITGVALLFIIASWAIVSGVSKMVAAIGLRKLIEGELILLLSGILSIIFGVVMLVFPEFTVSVYIGVIGFFSILLGIFLLSLAWRIKEEHEKPESFKIQSTEVNKAMADSTDSQTFEVEIAPVSQKTSSKPAKKAATGSKTGSSKSASKTTTKPKAATKKK